MKARVVSFLALLACAACGGGNANVEPAHPPHVIRHPKPPAPVKDLGFEAARLAVVPQGTFGPYLGTRPEGMIAAWAAEVSGKRSWLTRGLGDDGVALRYDPKTVADAAAEVDLVAIRPLGGGTRGFVLLTSSREFSGERVDMIALGTRGERMGGAVSLAQSVPAVVWLDAVQTASGAVAMWAVRRDDRADIVGVEIGASGAPKDGPATLVTDVRSWQAAPAGEGIAILALTAGKGRNEAGPLKLFFIDAQAKLERRSVVVSDGATAEADVDLAKVGDRLVAAWSDHKDGEPRLYGAVADFTGSLLKPAAPLARPFGPQSVVRIVSPQDGKGPAFLAWENGLERPEGGRAVRVATLSPNGVLGEQSALIEMDSDSPPELVATPKGIAALTLAKACRRSEACEGERAVPTYVRLDQALDVTASEPLRLVPESGEAAELAWGLVCRSDDCTALTVSSASPSPVYLVKLKSLSNDWVPAAGRIDAAAHPRVISVESVAKSEPLAQIAAARVGAATELAWLTYFDSATPFTRSKTPAPDGKYEPPRAIVRARRMLDKGASPDPVALSYRADSSGGVSFAAGDPARGTSLLMWVGIDNKIAQGFATVFGPDGKKLAQKMVTHAKLGISDVAATFTGDGWVLAWIDESNGSAEVHVTKVDPTLRVVVPERRVGAGGSTASSVQLVARGDRVFMVWVDAAVATASSADVFATVLATKDLTVVAPEHPLAPSPTRARAPTLASLGEGAVVGWVEDSAADDGPATLMLAQLDTRAQPVGGSIAPVTVDGSPESLGLECGESSCHAAVLASSSDGGRVEGFVWHGTGDVHVTKLVTLRAEPRGGLAPLVSNGDVLYPDQGARGEMVIRRLGVEWQ